MAFLRFRIAPSRRTRQADAAGLRDSSRTFLQSLEDAPVFEEGKSIHEQHPLEMIHFALHADCGDALEIAFVGRTCSTLRLLEVSVPLVVLCLDRLPESQLLSISFISPMPCYPHVGSSSLRERTTNIELEWECGPDLTGISRPSGAIASLSGRRSPEAISRLSSTVSPGSISRVSQTSRPGAIAGMSSGCYF